MILDEEKLKKAQEGDVESIESICSSTWEPVYRFVYYKVQNREEAEDITQDTYLKALSYFQKSSVKIDRYIGFLKAVSMNILRDRWRKNKHRETSIQLENADVERIAVEDPIEASAQRALIQNALEHLNQEQRAVIELRIIQGYSAAETARRMGKKEGTIRVLQYRALKALAAILRKTDDER